MSQHVMRAKKPEFSTEKLGRMAVTLLAKLTLLRERIAEVTGFGLMIPEWVTSFEIGVSCHAEALTKRPYSFMSTRLSDMTEGVNKGIFFLERLQHRYMIAFVTLITMREQIVGLEPRSKMLVESAYNRWSTLRASERPKPDELKGAFLALHSALKVAKDESAIIRVHAVIAPPPPKKRRKVRRYVPLEESKRQNHKGRSEKGGSKKQKGEKFAVAR